MAETPRYDHRPEVRKSYAAILKEHGASGIDRRLRPHDIVEVYLRQHDVPLDPGLGGKTQHVFHPAAAFPHPAPLLMQGELPVAVNGARHEKLRHEIDEARPAYPEGAFVPDRQDHRFKRCRVHVHLLDGTRGGPHAELYPAALECGPGRARRTQEPLVVPENDLTVRPDVHEEGYFIALRHARKRHPGDNVAADVGRNPGDRIDARVEPGHEPELTGVPRGKGRRRRCVRGQHDMPGVDAVQEVHHRRIPRDDDMRDIRDIDLCFQDNVRYEPVYRCEHHIVELREPPAFPAVHDARDDVFPVADLPVVIGRGCDDRWACR